MVHTTNLHAQISAAAAVAAANHHNLNPVIMNGRASSNIIGAATASSISHSALGLAASFNGSASHHSSIHSQHNGTSVGASSGISASNFNSSNHHQNHHHLGHNLHRNRHLSATAAAGSLNSHFTHSHFNSSNLSQNSHHHHHLSLSSNSSAMSSGSSSSSSPSASISPTSVTLGSPPQSANLGPIGFHQGSSSPFHAVPKLGSIENSHHSTPQQQPQQQNTSRYKTELCRPFEENGTCKYGEKCQFAHGLGELRTLTRHPKYKTEFCRTFHTTGFCPYGPRCHFIHNSKTPPSQAQLGLSSYSKLPFGHQTSHSASPSTSPISSTSSAATTNSSLSSAESTTSSTSSSSSSPPSSSRLLEASFPYRTIGVSNNGLNSSASNDHAVMRTSGSSVGGAPGLRRNENEDIGHATSGCASDTQRLFWLHSHMNEGSRWPPAMCASGLINSGGPGNNARRTWQMQA